MFHGRGFRAGLVLKAGSAKLGISRKVTLAIRIGLNKQVSKHILRNKQEITRCQLIYIGHYIII